MANNKKQLIIMKIKMSERELNTIATNIKKQVARLVNSYIDEMDKSEYEDGIYLVEKSNLVERILEMEIELQTIIQPKD